MREKIVRLFIQDYHPDQIADQLQISVSEVWAQLKNARLVLSPRVDHEIALRNQQIVKRFLSPRHGNKNMAEIARSFDLSRERVRQVLRLCGLTGRQQAAERRKAFENSLDLDHIRDLRQNRGWAYQRIADSLGLSVADTMKICRENGINRDLPQIRVQQTEQQIIDFIEAKGFFPSQLALSALGMNSLRGQIMRYGGFRYFKKRLEKHIQASEGSCFSEETIKTFKSIPERDRSFVKINQTNPKLAKDILTQGGFRKLKAQITAGER